MIIVLTGIDGAGKTTAGRLLAQRLGSEERPAVFATNSSGRRSIAAWCARRRIHPPDRLLDAVETSIRCLNVVVSHLRGHAGSRIVVMDRYLYCQSALKIARGLGPGLLVPLLIDVLPAPDVVFHFTLPAAVAHGRVCRRGADIETLDHLRAFDRAYEQLARFPSFIAIDAGEPVDRIVDEMVRELEGRSLVAASRAHPGEGSADAPFEARFARHLRERSSRRPPPAP